MIKERSEIFGGNFRNSAQNREDNQVIVWQIHIFVKLEDVFESMICFHAQSDKRMINFMYVFGQRELFWWNKDTRYVMYATKNLSSIDIHPMGYQKKTYTYLKCAPGCTRSGDVSRDTSPVVTGSEWQGRIK